VPGLLKAVVSVLRSKLGKVHVNLGEPISLDELLCRTIRTGGERRAGMGSAPRLDQRGRRRSGPADQHRNQCRRAVTPINLVAMAILATPRQALAEADLVRQVELYQQLLRDARTDRW